MGQNLQQQLCKAEVDGPYVLYQDRALKPSLVVREELQQQSSMAKKRKSNVEEVPAKAIKPDPELQQSSSSDSESEYSSSSESESESESESSSSSSSEEVEAEKESPPSSPSSSSSSSEEEEEEEEPKQETIKELLQPFSKGELISILKDAVFTDPSIASQIISSVDADPVHRKIFVHGLAWDVTNETLMSSFKPFGTILECRVVTDKLSGRSKGYGFVLFKTRAAARKALKEPQKKIGSRIAACQLASSGARRLYVANVGPQINLEKLRAFFEKFGEIEEGPLGFDKVTGKFKGYAHFVYKNLEGIRKALEEAVKVFDGVKLECSLAVEARGRKNNLAVGQSVVVSTAANATAVPAQGLPGLAVGLNPGLVGQNLNASAVLLGQNPALGILSSAFGVNPSGLINPVGLPSTFVGGVSQPLNRAPNAPPQALNLNGINPSVIGSYGSHVALQGLGAHQNQSSQLGLGAHQNQGSQQGLGAHQN